MQISFSGDDGNGYGEVSKIDDEYNDDGQFASKNLCKQKESSSHG